MQRFGALSVVVLVGGCAPDSGDTAFPDDFGAHGCFDPRPGEALSPPASLFVWDGGVCRVDPAVGLGAECLTGALPTRPGERLVAFDNYGLETCAVFTSGDVRCTGREAFAAEHGRWRSLAMWAEGITAATSQCNELLRCDGNGCTSRPLPDDAQWVAGGDSHACTISPDGELDCFFLDPSFGEEDFSAPGPYSMVGVPSRWGGCASRVAGGIDCWGMIFPVTMEAAPPIVATGMTVKDIFACALDELGEVHCWGQAGYDWNWSTAGPWPAGPFAEIASSYTQVCVLAPDESISCWNMLAPEPRPEDLPPDVRWWTPNGYVE